MPQSVVDDVSFQNVVMQKETHWTNLFFAKIVPTVSFYAII